MELGTNNFKLHENIPFSVELNVQGVRCVLLLQPLQAGDEHILREVVPQVPNGRAHFKFGSQHVHVEQFLGLHGAQLHQLHVYLELRLEAGQQSVDVLVEGQIF